MLLKAFPNAPLGVAAAFGVMGMTDEEKHELQASGFASASALLLATTFVPVIVQHVMFFRMELLVQAGILESEVYRMRTLTGAYSLKSDPGSGVQPNFLECMVAVVEDTHRTIQTKYGVRLHHVFCGRLGFALFLGRLVATVLNLLPCTRRLVSYTPVHTDCGFLTSSDYLQQRTSVDHDRFRQMAVTAFRKTAVLYAITWLTIAGCFILVASKPEAELHSTGFALVGAIVAFMQPLKSRMTREGIEILFAEHKKWLTWWESLSEDEQDSKKDILVDKLENSTVVNLRLMCQP
jgi:hypothetical protein